MKLIIFIRQNKTNRMINKFKHKELFLYSIFFAILCAVLYYRQIFLGLHYDDSFITYRYAVNFSEGKGFIFNEGERINSASSLLFTLILAGIHFMGFANLQIASSAIGLLSSFGSIYIVYSIITKIFDDRLLRANIFIPFVFSGTLVAWAVSGMESLFFLFLMLLFFKYYIKNNLIYSTFILCCLLICRAESVIIFATVIIVDLFYAIKNKNYKNLIIYSIFGSITIILLYAWNFFYFDSFVPQPVRFKNISRYYNPDIVDSIKDIVRFYFYKNIILTLLTLSAILQFILLFVKTRTINIENKLFVSLSIYLTLSVSSFIVGPYSDFNRYMIHTIPIMVILSAFLINQNYSVLIKYKFIQLISLSISLFITVRENQYISRYFSNSSVHQEKRILVGKYIDSNINHSDLIYSSDIGAISYFAINNKFVDLSGLTSNSPFNFIEKSQSNNYKAWLKLHKIGLVADTESKGKISSLEILNYPSNYFKNINRNTDYSLNLYDALNKIILKESIGGDMNIVLMRIHKKAYFK